jgi:hypothetical protein
MELGNELYVNNKWYWDIISISETKIEVRIKYKENNNTYSYKTIKLPTNLFKEGSKVNNVIHIEIPKIELKKIIGNLVNRLIEEPNIYNIFENVVGGSPGNTAGMGAVVSPGLSGTPGMTGSAGSGDISAHIDFGMEKLPASNIKHINTMLGKKKKKKKKVKESIVLKQPLIELNEDNDISDNKYKQYFFEFLDYPVDSGYDELAINSINKNRPEFLTISSQRIKAYLTNFYKMNKSFIDNKTSDNFQNMLSGLIN